MTAIDTKKLRELAAVCFELCPNPEDWWAADGALNETMIEEDVALIAALPPAKVIQLLDEIDRQKEQIAVAKAALEFYANFFNHTYGGTDSTNVLDDEGDCARAALKRMGEGK